VAGVPVEASFMAPLTEALKMAKESGLDRPESIQQFVTGYMQSGGDPLEAMNAVSDKTSLKELYYKNVTGRQGKTNPHPGVKDVAGYTYTPDPTGAGPGAYTKIPGLDDSMYKRGSGGGFDINNLGGESEQPAVPADPEQVKAFQAELNRRNQTQQVAPAPTTTRMIDPSDPFAERNYDFGD